MNIINVYEAKAQLSKIIDKACKGEEIYIGKYGVPKVQVIPIQKNKRRKPGYWKGKVEIKKGFDKLPKKVIDKFYGK